MVYLNHTTRDLMLKQTEICALNIDDDVLKNLSTNGIHAYNGTIGYLTKLVYGNKSTTTCLPNYDFPDNFHEYQIAIIDLTNESRIPYSADQHQHKDTVTSDHLYFSCEYPQDLFDPRPFSLSLLKEHFEENLKRGFLIIVFCSANSAIKYKSTKGTLFQVKPYVFTYHTPYTTNRRGKKTKIPREDGDIYNFLKKYNDQFNYEVIFDHPDRSLEGRSVPDREFTPLVLTSEDKIAGISWNTEKSGIFFFPNLDNKAKFLEEFLIEVAPTLFPHLFPDIVKDKWLEEERYHLPNQNRLVTEKQQLKKDYDIVLAAKNKEIADNTTKYEFLTNMITKTGNELVESVIQFLFWIGFDKAVDADKKRKKALKEEDINIETQEGLIVIEVKGIGGTPSDTDCSQIGKVRTRRQKERNSFKVFGHFIINHERHKPAATRFNPPFSPEQFQDAEYDTRGLITTWQLFNVYMAIEKGILTKSQVRSCFYMHGYIDFIPKTMIKLGVAAEILPKITVIIIHLDGSTKLEPNDKLLYKQDGEFKTVTIKSLRANDQPVQEATKGEFGIKLSDAIPKTAILYAYPKSN